MCFRPSAPPDPAIAQRAAEAARQGRIRSGQSQVNDIFGQFDDQFFGNRGAAVTGFFNPQVEEQFGDAREKSILNLARQGILESSAGAKRLGDLEGARTRELASVGDRARASESQARSDIAASKSNIFSQLNASSDPGTAASSALAQSQVLASPETFSPLGDLFTKFSQAGQEGLNEQARQRRIREENDLLGARAIGSGGASSVFN